MAGTHRHLIWFIFAVLLWNTAPQTAYGWSLFGPKTYNECVLEKIKDANNTAAVIAVKQSCRELRKKRGQKKGVKSTFDLCDECVI